MRFVRFADPKVKICDTTTMTATMCQLVSTGPAVNRAEPADFHCPPPLSPHLPGNLFSARLALGSPRSVTLALPQKPVPDRTKYFPLFRFATVVSAQCSSDTDSPRSSLCLTVSLLLLWHSSYLSGFISCYAWRKKPWTRRRPTTRSGRCSAGAVASRECTLNIRITTTSCQSQIWRMTRGNISPKKGVFKST